MARKGIMNPSRVGMELVANYMGGKENLEEWLNIIRGLVARGYSNQEIMKMIGGNVM